LGFATNNFLKLIKMMHNAKNAKIQVAAEIGPEILLFGRNAKCAALRRGV
jgi:hypothetical protein